MLLNAKEPAYHLLSDQRSMEQLHYVVRMGPLYGDSPFSAAWSGSCSSPSGFSPSLHVRCISRKSFNAITCVNDECRDGLAADGTSRGDVVLNSSEPRLDADELKSVQGLRDGEKSASPDSQESVLDFRIRPRRKLRIFS
jgi:hypothetical protein